MRKVLLVLRIHVFFCAVLAMAPTVAAEVFADAASAQNAASTYSAQSGGVGIVILYGTQNAISADDVGLSIVNEIKRRGYQSQYFVANDEQVGIGFKYIIGLWNSGLLDSTRAVSAMDAVIEKADVHARIVFLEARMAKNRALLIEKYGEDYLKEMEKRWVDEKR